MNLKIKSIICFFPKIIIFGMALFDFFYIHSHIQSSFGNGTTITFVEYPAWYERSTADLWLLLTASICLLISKGGSYIMSIILSGFIVVEGLLLLNRRSITLIEVWDYVQRNELNIWLQWEIQFFFAVIIFSVTVIYLIRDELIKKKITFQIYS
ncbi:MAG: hypothetical protein ABIP06_11955 [Pyrinomonadaceae bacterium]